MGYSARPENVRLCLGALEWALAGVPGIRTGGAGVTAAEALLASAAA
jgi:alanine-glyoxylate transaminase / serine-glyoxylate transaminase / serine-pyruvate transaminase